MTMLRELHGLSHDGKVVITVQWWERRTLVTFRNGRRVDRRTLTVQAIEEELRRAQAALAATALTDEQARVKLAELGEAEEWCPFDSCGGRLPVGGYRCLECGRSPTRHSTGALSGVYSRPPIVIRAAR